jgi:transketolase
MNDQINLRRFFVDQIYQQMKTNSQIVVVTGDLGYKLWDQVRNEFPARFINTGAAEQSMVGVAVGLAISHKIPLVYSISPFLLYRPFETIRNYLHHEKIPVKLIGSGRNRDYHNEGFSHWVEEDQQLLSALPNIKTSWPDTVSEISSIIPTMLSDQLPWYINLKR